MAITINLGEPFLKTCYFLQCYEAITKVSATVLVERILNLQAVARHLTGVVQPSDPVQWQLIAFAKICTQPGLDYFERQLESSLKASMAALK